MRKRRSCELVSVVQSPDDVRRMGEFIEGSSKSCVSKEESYPSPNDVSMIASLLGG